MQKAYDSVDRELLFRILRGRVKSEMEGHLLSLIEELHRTSLIEVGNSTLVAEMGLPQGVSALTLAVQHLLGRGTKDLVEVRVDKKTWRPPGLRR